MSCICNRAWKHKTYRWEYDLTDKVKKAESKSWLIWLEQNGTYKNKRHIVSLPHMWLHDSHKLDRVKYLVFGTQHDYFLHHPKRLSKLQKIMLEEREQRWVTKISANFQDYRERKKERNPSHNWLRERSKSNFHCVKPCKWSSGFCKKMHYHQSIIGTDIADSTE